MKITVSNLSHIYDIKSPAQFLALDNVSLKTLPQGITAFIGHNGSGKTTLIKHLNALLFPTSGEVIVDEHIIKPLAKPRKRIKDIIKYRRNVGIVFQFPEEQFFAETVGEEIIFGIKAFKMDEQNLDARLKDVLQLVGLDESFIAKNPFELSGGQKRRVALASVLILNQELLILDEPTASLDSKGALEVYKIIRAVAAQGKKVIVITHDLQNILEYADEVVVFADQKIIASGDPVEVLYNLELLKNSKLEPPKIVELVNALNQKGLNVPRVKNMNQIISFFERSKHE